MSTPADPYWLKLLPTSLQDKLAGRARLHAVIHNSGWLLFDKLIRMVLGLLVGAWVARYLGPAQYGELAYVLAYIAFFQAVANLGMDGIIVRDIARNPSVAEQILGTTFALRLVAGTGCWLVAIGSMAWLNGWQDRSVTLTALAGGSLAFQATDTIDLWFQSQSQSRLTVVAKLVAYLLSSGAKITLILIHAPLVAFGAVMALDALTAAMGLAIAYRRYPTAGRWRQMAGQGKTLLQESWPFILSGVSIMVYMRIDQIMLKGMLGDKSLGIYAAALPLSSIWQFIPVTLATSFAPYIAQRKAESEQRYMTALSNVFRLFSGLALLTCIPTALLATFIVQQLYGTAYSETATVLAIHVFTNLFISLGAAQGLWLVNEGKSWLSLYKTVIGAAICIIGNWVLIPHFGVTGAAVVAVCAQAGSAVLSNWVLAPQIFKMQLLSTLQRKLAV